MDGSFGQPRDRLLELSRHITRAADDRDRFSRQVTGLDVQAIVLGRSADQDDRASPSNDIQRVLRGRERARALEHDIGANRIDRAHGILKLLSIPSDHNIGAEAARDRALGRQRLGRHHDIREP